MSSASILLNKGKKELEKQTYETRKFQVSIVKGRISDASDDHVTSINNKIDDIGVKLSDGVKGISAVSTLTSEMANKKEKSGTGDGYLSTYSNDLDSEIADCDTKIGELETEISSLSQQYETALHDEQEAAKKVLEDAKKLVFG